MSAGAAPHHKGRNSIARYFRLCHLSRQVHCCRWNDDRDRVVPPQPSGSEIGFGKRPDGVERPGRGRLVSGAMGQPLGPERRGLNTGQKQDAPVDEVPGGPLRRRAIAVARQRAFELRRDNVIGDDAHRILVQELDWAELSAGGATA